MTKSRTRDALAMLAAMPGLSQAAAARLCGLHWATVSKAVAAQRKPRCKHCGQTLRHALAAEALAEWEAQMAAFQADHGAPK